MPRICIGPRKPQSVGGPTSFLRGLVAGLTRKGIEITYDLDDEPYESVLVINGTRELAKLLACKRRGVRVVQRLGGINWLHKYMPYGVRGYLLSEIRNSLMRLVRSYAADHIVYQSHFVRDWWHRRFGESKVESSVIHNGVDLGQFSPQGTRYEPRADVCIISVEGTQGSDPFDIAVRLAQGLEQKGAKIELLMFGKAHDKFRSKLAVHSFVNFMGVIDNRELSFFYRSAAFYIATDIIAACPNAALEALACGTPVLGYKAGALPELIGSNAGQVVATQGNPWQGEDPGSWREMVRAAFDLVNRNSFFRTEARRLAENRYGLERMVDAYLQVLTE